ncbi:MAG TPA: hypothetical protein DDZ80_23160 [Cyanobacteria bacterium UBA8803]|nr:hypothetical protein [Cyanobacteria bacterium UBA9273]HBL61226.1 hypothetical protein [Cyanobacteria bacterium UBA8803]
MSENLPWGKSFKQWSIDQLDQISNADIQHLYRHSPHKVKELTIALLDKKHAIEDEIAALDIPQNTIDYIVERQDFLRKIGSILTLLP